MAEARRLNNIIQAFMWGGVLIFAPMHFDPCKLEINLGIDEGRN
jgi:hypothetical protein